jgi:positive regulator of sigma E activity
MHNRSLLKPLLAVAFVTALLLLLPLVAMQVTAGVRWGPGDFLAAGCLIFGTGAGMVLVARYTKRTGRRVALMGVLALVFAVVWAELAVGIFS